MGLVLFRRVVRPISSVRSVVRWRSSLSSRAFSLSREVLSQCVWLSVKGRTSWRYTLKAPMSSLSFSVTPPSSTLQHPERVSHLILTLVGFYRTVSLYANALRLPLEPNAVRFPVTAIP